MLASMKIVQCLLRSERVSMFCWLREEERLKVGTVIRLDEDCRTWTVETVGYAHEYFIVQELEEKIL